MIRILTESQQANDPQGIAIYAADFGEHAAKQLDAYARREDAKSHWDI